uniref:Uncharacterized protein n=1 Tax=Acrobeloides nanus TaxID=290746 RepID=A0A914E6D6_9BILA
MLFRHGKINDSTNNLSESEEDENEVHQDRIIEQGDEDEIMETIMESDIVISEKEKQPEIEAKRTPSSKYSLRRKLPKNE